jgi:drug/metabolite transporter (DMT)-like permease
MVVDILLAFLVAVIIGSFPFAMRYANDYMSINVILFLLSLTFFVSVTLHNLFFYPGNFLHQLQKIKQSAALVVIAAGFLTFFITNIIYFYVIKSTSNLNISISIMTLSTIVSILLGIIFIKNDLTIGTIIGLSFVSMGLFIMVRFSTFLK